MMFIFNSNHCYICLVGKMSMIVHISVAEKKAKTTKCATTLFQDKFWIIVFI